jgi:predicted transcriptional regulator
MKYRSRTELIATILRCAEGLDGALLTHIMYNSFLSHAQLKRIFPSLIEGGLIVFEEKNKVYKTTRKGSQYLKLYSQIEELVKIKNSV